jgi:hypothetical protein
MADPRIDWPDLSSQLIHFPAYVHAIGMMVVEMTSMEVMLGDVLGSLLNLNDGESHQIYFTPKATIARIDVLANLVSCEPFATFPTVRKATNAVVKRAKALMGKRHSIIHAHWIVLGDGQMVGRLRPPFESENGPEEVKLTDLETLVSDIRQLTRDARSLGDQIEETMRPDAWPERRAQLARSAAFLRRDNHRLLTQLQAQKDPLGPSQA